MKSIINIVKKALKCEAKKQPDFTYQIEDGNDIATEIAKKFLIESIDISEIMKKCDADCLDDSQKSFILKSLKYIVSQIKDIQ